MVLAMAGGFAVTAGAGLLVVLQKHRVGAAMLIVLGVLATIGLSETRGVVVRGAWVEGLLAGLPALIAAMWWLGRRERRASDSPGSGEPQA